MSFFFQAEDGIRDLVRSRGLGDVYKRQEQVERPGDGQGNTLRSLDRKRFRSEFAKNDMQEGLSLIHI